MIKKLRSKKFYKKYYNTKKDYLERYLLEYNKCEIGDDILCFEDRDLSFDPRFARNSYPEKFESFTVGRVYKILDKRKGKIKIKGDKDKLIWTTPKRFLGKLALRKIKLEKLEKRNKKYNINIFTE